MNYYLVEYFDYRNSKNYTFKIWADNEYDAWNMCLYKNDYDGYELGRGEECSKNILITSVYIIGDSVNGLYKEVA
tara:strand:+ start:1316 stop:1540 length:225 start_codon:yes stop_codon:yes gene_type:complete